MQPLTSILSLPWVTAGGLNADLSLGGLLGRVGIGLKLRIGGKDTPPPPPANDPPVAQSDTAEVRENGSLSVNASDGVIQSAQRPGSRDSDPNGDAIVVRSVKSSAGVEAAAGKALQGTYGTLTLNADGSTELGTVVIRIFGKDEPAQTLSMSDVLESHGTIAMPQSTAAERTDGDLQGVTSPALVAESLVWHTGANELLNPVLY